MRMFRQGLVATILVFSTATVLAQGSQYDTDKFRQLEEILPTPNGTRAASGAPAPGYWQQNADYEIHVELDDEKQRIVGNETIQAGVSRSIPESLFIFIPNGVDTEQFSPVDLPREKLDVLLQLKTNGKRILLSCGRLVKRKGVNWFIKNVMPGLADNVIYIIAGTGPEKENIRNIVAHSKIIEIKPLVVAFRIGQDNQHRMNILEKSLQESKD